MTGSPLHIGSRNVATLIPAISLTDLSLLYGEAGARDSFEQLCAIVISRQFPGAARIRVHRGDGGIDTYVGNWAAGGDVHVFQVKYFTHGLGKSQKQQIRHSFRTCVENGSFKTARWTLCLPIDLSHDETKWFEAWASSGDRAGIVEVPPWGALRLDDLLSQDSNRGIRERFLREDHLTQIREIHRVVVGAAPRERQLPDGYSYARILMPPSPGARMFCRSDGSSGMVRDLSLFPLMMEEVIAAGAMEVVVPSDGLDASVVPDLPAPIRARVRVLDMQAVNDEALEMLEPVGKALGIGFIGHGGLSNDALLPSELFSAFGAVLNALPDTLIAIDHQLQVALDCDRLVRACRTVRHECADSSATARLAEFEGFLMQYSRLNLTTLRATAEDRVDVDHLAASPTYRALSVYAWELGISELAQLAARKIKEQAIELVSSGDMESVRLRRMSIQASAKTDTTAPQSRFMRGYYPPFVPMPRLVQGAYALWKVRQPSPLFYGGQSRDDFGDLSEELYPGNVSSLDVDAWVKRRRST